MKLQSIVYKSEKALDGFYNHLPEAYKYKSFVKKFLVRLFTNSIELLFIDNVTTCAISMSLKKHIRSNKKVEMIFNTKITHIAYGN